MFRHKNVEAIAKRAKRAIQRLVARTWQYAYGVKYRLAGWRLRYASISFAASLFLIVSASFYVAPILQSVLARHYATEREIEGLRSLILNTGSALIGAAAIVTSLVLFAMQVNIERMPHGLFRRLSADPKLLGAFALAFLLAIGIATLSTIVDHGRLAYVVLTASWAVVFILISFLYAYRRALLLINPLRQLGILLHATRKELRVWARRAQRARPLLEREESAGEAMLPPSDSTHDLISTTFFQINSHWTDGAMRSLRHAMSFARRYAEQGDYEVSGAALNAVIGINAAYIESKGKTFYANNPFIENPFASDSFINDTLEHLRQNAQSGLARRDEQQIEQTLQTMAALVRVYLGIDYSSPYAAKSHAQLAAGYLSSVVQAVVPHDMADVLLEGQRLMGQSAGYVLAHGDPNDIAVLSEKIALIACTGCAKEDYRPVTMEGMTQLANLTFDLLRSRNHDIHFAVGEVRRDVALVAKLFLNVPDTPLSSSHSAFLGPYYSSTSMQSLRARLTEMANAIAEAQPDNADAQAVIRNMERWADGLYQTEKELLLAAIKAKSHFVCRVQNYAELDVHMRPFRGVALELDRHSPAQIRHASKEVAMSRACRKRPVRLHAQGPLVPYLEPYAEYLADHGYSQVAFWKKTYLVAEFSRWLHRGGTAINEITGEHEEAFLRDRAQYRLPKAGDHFTLSGMVDWLRGRGVINGQPAIAVDVPSIERILQEYGAFLLEARGLAPTSIENYCGYVRRFLMDVAVERDWQLASVKASQIADYLRRNAPKDRKFVSAKHIVTSLRSFFRFARSRGYIHGDLAAAVPSVAGWSMASIPRAMPADCLQTLLKESATWKEPAGLRNRAILLLLARLGLRASEVIQLELDDIDWDEGCLTVHGKSRERRPLPLPHDVGQAIATYLEHGRPRSSSRRVFLCAHAPYGELRSGSDISVIVARALKRAGIESRSGGAHQLRHALAVGMLRRGASLTEIGQVLRHRSPQATRRYAKVDIEALREVALPWPGELP